MESKILKSAIESLLFVSGEPLKIAKIAKICDIPRREIDTAVEALIAEYSGDRGLRIVRKGEILQMTTASENFPFVNRLVSGEMSSDLSKSALQTLAIIAYRGTVTRLQIEAVRGVNCSYTLRGLLVRGLVERKESPGVRGYSYEISMDFLRYMGLQNINELPNWAELSKNETVESALNQAKVE